jgi:hypothetical protein
MAESERVRAEEGLLNDYWFTEEAVFRIKILSLRRVLFIAIGIPLLGGLTIFITSPIFSGH